ncbi:MAG: SDR family oxidoreductase [Chloroflexi bacterium]|nr:SDR family oxidoreductase [Chloroflexota bacterium]
MKVLVMGGSRFNGFYLVQELVRQGHEVTVFNRGLTPTDFPPEVRRRYGDRKDHQQLPEVLGREEFDCIQDISAYTLDDVQSMVELFEGRAGHYIFASSTVVYAASKVLPLAEDFPVELGPLQQDYGRNKILCEQYLIGRYRERHFPVTIARFSMVLGPRNIIAEREQMMFVRLLRGRKILVPGDGTTLGQVGHVEDEARALRMMMLNPRAYGQIYNVTGNQYFTDDGYVDTIAAVVGVAPQKVYVPAPVMDELYPLGVSRLERPLIQRLAPYIHGWKAPVVFSIQKLRDHLGFAPAYTFASGMRQTYEWFQQEGLADRLEFDFRFEDELLARLGGE